MAQQCRRFQQIKQIVQEMVKMIMKIKINVANQGKPLAEGRISF